eukprot:942801_1
MSAAPCAICTKNGYPNEGVMVNMLYYHKLCFKCSHCNQRLTMGSFAQMQGTLYCKIHFKQLFASLGGSYDKVLESGRDSMLSRGSATEKSVGEKSASEKSATKKSTTKKSATKRSATKRSATKRSATKKSATEKSATEKSGHEKSDQKFTNSFGASEQKNSSPIKFKLVGMDTNASPRKSRTTPSDAAVSPSLEHTSMRRPKGPRRKSRLSRKSVNLLPEGEVQIATSPKSNDR